MSQSLSIHMRDETKPPQMCFEAYDDFVCFKMYIGDTEVLVFMTPEQVGEFKWGLSNSLEFGTV